MAGINTVALNGRLTKDPEVRQVGSGQAVCSFTLAVDRVPDKNGEKSADFPNCVAWGKTAEILGQYAEKGSQIGISGRLQTRSYDDKDGRKVYVTEVVADRLQLLDSGKQRRSDYPSKSDSITKDDISAQLNAEYDPESDLPF